MSWFLGWFVARTLQTTTKAHTRWSPTVGIDGCFGCSFLILLRCVDRAPRKMAKIVWILSWIVFVCQGLISFGGAVICDGRGLCVEHLLIFPDPSGTLGLLASYLRGLVALDVFARPNEGFVEPSFSGMAHHLLRRCFCVGCVEIRSFGCLAARTHQHRPERGLFWLICFF